MVRRVWVLVAGAAAVRCLDASGIVLSAGPGDGGDAAAFDSSTPSPITLRLANLSNDTDSVALCVTSSGGSFVSPVTSFVMPLNVTAPLTFDAGTYDLRIVSLVTAACNDTIVETFGEHLSNGAYTLTFIGDPPSDAGTAHPLELLVLADDAPGNLAAVRPLNVATQVSSVSLNEVLDGSVEAITNPLSYATLATQNASANGYLALAAGTYTFICQTTLSTQSLTGINVTNGRLYSLFLVDNPNSTAVALVCDDLAVQGDRTLCVVH